MNSKNMKQWMEATKNFQQHQFMQRMMEQTSLFNQDSFSSTEKFPPCDVYQHGEYLYIEIELPGLTKDEIRVTLHPQKVMIKGNYQTLHPSCQYYLKERNSKKFEKEINLPLPVSEINIRHYFQNGLLKIELPIEGGQDDWMPDPRKNSDEN